MSVGLIHSIESMGLVDGPGIRFVIFMKGCTLRCKFCHNPDTWDISGASQFTPDEIIKKALRFVPYFNKSGGGVTFSGGEPLLQPEFLLDSLKLLKKHGIHTCIDTAGVGHGGYDEILKYTDLVLYDVKHYEKEAYKALTLHGMNETLSFVEALKRSDTPVWVRHVVIPNLTDSDEHIKGLSDYIKTLPNVERVELLPYHLLGKQKYERLNIPYPLENVPSMDKERCMTLQTKYFANIGGNNL